jgi:hypothetical protein
VGADRRRELQAVRDELKKQAPKGAPADPFEAKEAKEAKKKAAARNKASATNKAGA